jgi:hypothetical protein
LFGRARVFYSLVKDRCFRNVSYFEGEQQMESLLGNKELGAEVNILFCLRQKVGRCLQLHGSLSVATVLHLLRCLFVSPKWNDAYRPIG